MPIHNTAGANVLRCVDDNVDTGTVLFGQFGYRFSIRHIERHNFNAFDFAEITQTWKRSPGICNSDKND